MRTIGNNSIVVGIDGSPASAAALAWAIEEAARRKLPLHLVGGEDPITAASAQARDVSPLLVVTAEANDGHPAAALVALSSYADTVVLGNRHRGAGAGALAGFMSTQVAMHADCPVVVVGAAPPDGIVRHGVVVGVDGSAVSDQALCYAFEQASSRRTGLEIVHAWWSTVPAGLTNELRLGQVAEERLAVSESVVGWSERFSDVTVRQHLPLGPAVFALVETAKYAELLVVGSRGQGRLRAVLLGSVSHGVLQHATCPVAVVRQASAVDTHREMVSTSAGSTGFAT